jgi:predicted nucleotidyltransferase component of viral defense system
MIDRQEILEFVGEVGLDPNVVEKDYVLGWMLAGIAQHPRTRDTWVFKGGTCLKKCYFETYDSLRTSTSLCWMLRTSTKRRCATCSSRLPNGSTTNPASSFPRM